MADKDWRTARNRRHFRTRIVPAMADKEVLGEADYLAGFVRLINQGAPHVYRKAELLARLRMLHHEAAKRRLTIPWDRTTGVRT
jgi:hypothetical protein